MPKFIASGPRDNVIDLFSRQPRKEMVDSKLIRIAPELDGLEMLYSNGDCSETLFSINIIAWGLRCNGEVVGLVPWLNRLLPCDSLNDDINGKCQGYYDRGLDEIFFAAPFHKISELETAVEYFKYKPAGPFEIVQEIPDSLGTHAAMAAENASGIVFSAVVSWRLYNNGDINGMLIEQSKVDYTPVLPGDPCLYSAEQNADFRYFFQHEVANQLMQQEADSSATQSDET